MSTSGAVDFLVSYNIEDRDWAEWIASHLGALGYAYALQEAPSGPGVNPLGGAAAAVGSGQDVIVIVSYALIEALHAGGATEEGQLRGTGRAVAVQIEPLDAPAGLADLATARMHESADDYATSRDLLVEVVRDARPEPASPGDPSAARRRVGLPAPVALAESYPVPAPPEPAGVDAGLVGDAAAATTVGGMATAAGAVTVGAAVAAAEAEASPDGGARSVGLFEVEPASPGDEAVGDTPEAGSPVDPDAVIDLTAARARGADESGRVPDADIAGPHGADGADGGRKWLPYPRPLSAWNRTAELAQLAAKLAAAATSPNAPTSSVALIGSAGAGKTWLALEHAARHVAVLDVVWWVRAGSRAAAVADVRRLGERLGVVSPEMSAGDAVIAVNEALADTPKPWLLVFDGCTSWSDVADVVPRSGRGQVLLTSANRRLGSTGDVIEIDGFEPSAALAYLLDRTSRTDATTAARVVERVGGLPVALELAAGYAIATGAGFGAYVAALDDPAPPPGSGTNPPVAVVESCILTALRAVGELSPAAVAALGVLCSGTADAPLPHRLVDDLGIDGEPPLVEVLSSYGLAVADGRRVAIPSAVRQAVSYLLADLPHGDAGREPMARLLAGLDTAVAGAVGDDLDLLAPHAAVAAATLAPAAPGAPGARLAVAATTWTAAQGARHDAVGLAEQSLELHERAFGPADGATRAARRQLADCYVAAGDTTRALATQASVLADYEAGLGPTDLRTIEASAALARSCHEFGDHGHAVHYGERAVAGLTALHGAEHPDTVAAAELLELSRREAATAGEEGAVTFVTGPPAASPATTNGSFGVDQAPPAVFVSSPAPDVGWPGGVNARADADVRRLTGQLAEVEVESGSESLDALAVRHELAVAYGDAGDHVTAGLLLGEVVVGCRRLLGPDHLDTLTARANLANAYAEAGSYRAAIAEQEQVVADHERLLGADDPLTLTARNSLANSYASAGLHAQALVHQQRVVADYERTHGSEHPNTLTAQHNLANSYADLGRHDEALALRQRILLRREEVLGAEHPQTLGARNNLANSYADLGRHDEALALRRQVVEDRERLLGAEHPQTLGARNNLANSYADLGRHDEALAIRVQVLEGRERVLGPDHPHTLTARNNLANSYAGLDRQQEALELRLQALADCERVLGPTHPHTLTARNNLANTHAALGDEAEAARLRAEVAAAYAVELPPPPPPPLPNGSGSQWQLAAVPDAQAGAPFGSGASPGNPAGGSGQAGSVAVDTHVALDGAAGGTTEPNETTETTKAAETAHNRAANGITDVQVPAGETDATLTPSGKKKRKFWFWTR